MRSAMIGFVLGLFAGLCIAFLLELFDIRVRRPDEIAQILRQPILGRIPRISRKLLGESAAGRRSSIRTGTLRRRSAWCAPTWTS